MIRLLHPYNALPGFPLFSVICDHRPGSIVWSNEEDHPAYETLSEFIKRLGADGWVLSFEIPNPDAPEGVPEVRFKDFCPDCADQAAAYLVKKDGD